MIQQDVRNKLIRDASLMVLASLLLYRLTFTNILFTIPLLLLAPRFEDRKYALLPVAVVFLLVVGGELFTARNALTLPTTPLILIIGLFIPVTLLVAAAVWIWLRGRRNLVRYLASCAFAVVGGFGLAVWLQSGSEVVAKVAELYSSTFKALFSSLMPTTSSLIPTGEVAQVASETTILGLNADVLFALCVQVVYRTFVPMCMALIGVSALLSECMLHRQDDGWQRNVSNWRLPENTIWVFLGAWTVVLVNMLLSLPDAVSAVVMNLALAVSLLYMVQGISILLFLIRKRNPFFSVSRAVVFVIICLILPGLNALVVLALPLLGALETWITFRKND